ncbi:hypothetical protein HK096_000204, partial [Nowakowskiella sp. JEL0078]
MAKKKLRDSKGGPLHDEKLGPRTVFSLHKTGADGVSPVLIIRSGLSDPSLLFKDATPEDDAATRRTDRLVRMIVINDFTGASFNWTYVNPRFLSVFSHAGKNGDMYYPMLLGTSVAVNPPKAYVWGFNMVKHILPQKTVEAVTMCTGDVRNGDVRKCPFASKMLKHEDVPSFLGGQCRCTKTFKYDYQWFAGDWANESDETGFCICGVPNDRFEPLSKNEILIL